MVYYLTSNTPSPTQPDYSSAHLWTEWTSTNTLDRLPTETLNSACNSSISSLLYSESLPSKTGNPPVNLFPSFQPPSKESLTHSSAVDCSIRTQIPNRSLSPKSCTSPTPNRPPPYSFLPNIEMSPSISNDTLQTSLFPLYSKDSSPSLSFPPLLATQSTTILLLSQSISTHPHASHSSPKNKSLSTATLGHAASTN